MLQTDSKIKEVRDTGCLFMSLLSLGDEPLTEKFVSDMYSKCVEDGTIQPNCFVNNRLKVLKKLMNPKGVIVQWMTPYSCPTHFSSIKNGIEYDPDPRVKKIRQVCKVEYL